MSSTRVRSNGEIKWGRELVFLSEALIGEPVGIAETEPGDWLVRFATAAACVLSCPLPVLQPRHRRASAAPRRHPHDAGGSTTTASTTCRPTASKELINIRMWICRPTNLPR
jgi:hypothetical protein